MQFDGTSDLKELLSVTLKLFFLQRKFYIYIFIFLYFYILYFKYYARASCQLALQELWEEWVQNLRSPTYRAWTLLLRSEAPQF
jgi:hypothetical protein